MLTQPPFLVVEFLHLTWQRLPRDAVVLDQTGQLHASIEQRGDNLAKSVIPYVRGGVLKLHLGLDVGARLVKHHRLWTLEVVVIDDESVGMALIQAPQHRMPLAEEQTATRRQQL